MWTLLIISVILCLFSYFINRRFDNPAFLFSAIWTFIIVLFVFQLYNIPLTDQSFFIILVMVISFPMGVFVSTVYYQGKDKYLNYAEDDSDYGYVLRKKIFWIICIFSIVVMFFDEISIIINIFQGSSFIDIINENGSVQTVTMSGWKAAAYLYIIYPATYFVSPICAVEILSEKSRKMPYIVLNLMMIFLAVMHHGARLNIILAIIVYTFGIYIFGKKFYVPKRMKRVLFGVIVIAIVAIVWLSASRGIEKIWSSFYMYFLCEFPVMDNLLNSNIVSGHTLGYLSFNGITYPLFSLFKIFGFGVPNVYTYTQTIRQFLESNWVHISGYEHNLNAFLPAGAFFYIDGGYMLEFVGIFFSGGFCNMIYQKMKRKKDARTIATYLLIIVAILLSFFRYYGTSYQFVLGLIYIQFIYKREILTVGR